jgi:hypothetical protein
VWARASAQLDMAPCACPGGLTGDYRLVAYTDGDIDASGCNSAAPCGGGVAWDGVFHYSSACYWIITEAPSNACIDGQLLDSANSISSGQLKNAIELNTTLCRWEMVLWLMDAGVNYVIWQGVKYTGDTPAGTYQRTGGCDTTTSLEVEAVPA